MNSKAGTGKTFVATGVAMQEARYKELVLPAGILDIQEEAFKGIAARTVRCPEGLTHIGAHAFAYCEELKRIFIPGSVVDIDETAFEDCVDLWIFAPEGSAAEEYAEQHTMKFFAIR